MKLDFGIFLVFIVSFFVGSVIDFFFEVIFIFIGVVVRGVNVGLIVGFRYFCIFINVC